jgi:membrane-bound lytic murein transglycosylase A
MIEQGYLDREHSSGEDIMRYLRNHREHVREILSQNPSFIFFKKMPPGPFGNIGVALTPRHSVATDSGLMPAGALILLSTTLPPLEQGGPTETLHLHPVMNQDTGGAIKTPRRMDLFLGRGVQNEYQAAHLKSEAEALYVYFEVR